MAPVDKTALECVMEVDTERIKLEAEAERLASLPDDDGKINQISLFDEEEMKDQQNRSEWENYICQKREKE